MRTRLLLALAAFPLLGAAPADMPQPLVMAVEGLRSTQGVIRICLTSRPDFFPDCAGDPDKRNFSIPAGESAAIPLGSVPPGGYALAIIHDQNSNRKLDTFMGIPREGVGFSRNPPIRFGAPSFRSARFDVAGGEVRQQVRMRYFL